MTDRIGKTIELAAPIERVWQAITDHREFGAWFRVELEGPFIPGRVTKGRITYPGAEHLTWEGRVEAMERPRYFAFRWPVLEDPRTGLVDRDHSTLVEFLLRESAGGTRLTVTESGFDAIPADKRDSVMRRNSGGWEEQVRNIKAHLDG